MTISESYREYRQGKINKAQFMERARKDNLLKHLVTNVMSFDDTVKVLKNKRIIQEGVEIIPAEIRKGITYELGLTYEMTPGWSSDFIGKEELDRVTKRVHKNLEKDPLYYSKMVATGQKPEKEEKKNLEYKESRVNDTTNKTKPDGYLKKELKKDEKSNTGARKENKTKKNAGIKVMSDKGVEGSEKIISEGKYNMKALREMVRKALHELLFDDPKVTGDSPVIATSDASQRALRQAGMRAIPGTSDVKAVAQKK